MAKIRRKVKCITTAWTADREIDAVYRLFAVITKRGRFPVRSRRAFCLGAQRDGVSLLIKERENIFDYSR